MSIKQQIESDFISAFKQKEEGAVALLRLLKAGIKNLEIEKKGELDESEVVKFLKTEKKKRLEVIEIYDQQNRKDLSDREKKEVEIIEKYLPKSISEEEIKKAIKEAIESLGDNKNNFGMVMKETMKKLGGFAEGQVVSRLVKEILG